MITKRQLISAPAAYLLHWWPYRESSLLLEVFAQGEGRVGLVAKGWRRGGKSRANLLQPFRELEMSWSAGKELGTLRSAEEKRPAWALSRESLLCAFYVNELTLRLLHRHEPEAGLFEVYRHTLERLACDATLATALRYYERDLLAHCGYGLQLHHEAEGDTPITAHQRYHYIPGRGPVVAVDAGKVVTGDILMALRDNGLRDESMAVEAKRVTHAELQRHIGDKPLKSRELYDEYLRRRNVSQEA